MHPNEIYLDLCTSPSRKERYVLGAKRQFLADFDFDCDADADVWFSSCHGGRGLDEANSEALSRFYAEFEEKTARIVVL